MPRGPKLVRIASATAATTHTDWYHIGPAYSSRRLVFPPRTKQMRKNRLNVCCLFSIHRKLQYFFPAFNDQWLYRQYFTNIHISATVGVSWHLFMITGCMYNMTAVVRCTSPVVIRRIRDAFFSKLPYPSISARTAPPVSVRVRVRVSFTEID